MASFIGFVIGSFFLSRLIYKDENSDHENLPLIIGIICTSIYITIRNAIRLTGTESQAIQGGLIFSICVMLAIFIVIYLIHNFKMKPDVSKDVDISNTPLQSDVIRAEITETKNRIHFHLPSFKRTWLVPLVIALILLLSWAFRWHEIASKTYDTGVARWTEDRWTGTVWLDVYTPKESITRAVSGSEQNAYNATTIWRWAVALDTLWLAYASWGSYKKKSPATIE